MKLKRIAMVAAAAVVGPTVLMATPAMADEVANPAVTTPDAAPKDDAAPATGETTETPAPEAQKPGSAQQPQAPEAQKPQQQPAQGAEAEKKDEKKADEQVAVAGPKLTLDGLPAAFSAGGGWSQFSLHVDNSGRPAVDDHSLELVLWTLDTFGWESGDIQTEIYAPDSKGAWGWHAVEAYGSEEVYSFSLADVDVEKNEVFDLKLRMKFGKDTPPSRFSLSTTAEGGTGDRVRYESRVTAPGQEENNGPAVSVQGLPAGGFTAGGAWHEFSLGVDNTGKKKIDEYGFTLIFDNAVNTLQGKHLDLEIWNGGRWVPAVKDPSGQLAGTIVEHSVGKDAKFDIKLRAKFSKDAPVGKIFAVVLADDHGVDDITSDVAFGYSSIKPASTGNQPTPDGGAKPIVDGNGNGNGTGNGSGTGNGTGTTSTTGGQLAETGSDAATSWALGGAGVALAMGAALVAGTGRRRRPTA
ncbi:hypothetical protein [Streptomyces sp. NRRL S-237]|uniref:hypothetical protein n=1 Tax=Streptomyces sp. NRRL S-237 TaxID=1463895 RepID=UPI000AB84FA3|nr:hypothetical protein [Streptomyces sp. NRRL S-237]